MSKNKRNLPSQTILSFPANQLLNAQSESEINEVVQLFNVNLKKKDIIRAGKLSELQDQITEQMLERVQRHAGEFSNKDLLDYFNTIQNSLKQQDLDNQNIKVPQIAVQNNVNVNIEDSLSRESREKIADVISQLLAQNSQIVDNQ